MDIHTPIPTPSGWTTMGELKPGDQVFDENGSPCRVVAVSPVMIGRPCYSLRFSDGAEIVADAQHEWVTQNSVERAAELRSRPAWKAARRSKRPSRATGRGLRSHVAAVNAMRAAAARVNESARHPSGTRTTEEIARTLLTKDGRGLNHSVAVAGALQLPEAALPIDPYLLGAWLGDGQSSAARMCMAEPAMVELLTAAAAIHGWDVRKGATKYDYGVTGGLLVTLRSVGVLANKHIPGAYQRASVEQRIALLQGLMDTDGYAEPRGQCEFTTTSRALAEGVLEIVRGLGCKAALSEGIATLYGRPIGPKYRIKFMAHFPAFRLQRKLDRQKLSGFRDTVRRRYIEDCAPVESRPVRCIEVDSPSHLFLAGPEMVPTHNSHLMRIALIVWCAAIPGLQCYIFRRVLDDLIKNHIEGPKGFRALLAPWKLAGIVDIVEDEIRFWNGSKIYLCHCKDPAHVYKYHGAEIHVLVMDELTTFLETMYRYLRNRVRMVGINVPAQYSGRFPRILCGTNPGNVGHLWVKRTFIDNAEPMAIRRVGKSEGGMLRQFIPAHLEDNPSMAQDDPGYEDRLEGLGSDALVKAMRWGDWNIIDGAFFDCWDAKSHIIAPFAIPEHWTRVCGYDWGTASPFSVGWWAVSSEAYVSERGVIPRGALVRYREWYGCKKDEAGASLSVGLKMTNVAMARGIRELERRKDGSYEPIAARVADPSIFAVRGGPSIAEEMGGEGVWFTEGDNKRVAGEGPISGWGQVRQRMVGQDDRPMLYVFSTCHDFIRTVPALQHDKNRPEDVDSSGEDHIGDETRYVCMSRPWTAPAPVGAAKPKDYGRNRAPANNWKTA